MGNLCAGQSDREPLPVKGLSNQCPKPIRILIAHKEPIFRRGLRAVFDTQPDLRVVGEASDGAAAVKLAGKHAPDILLVDLDIPGLAGLEVLRQVQRWVPQVHSIILALKMETPETLEALELGARGVMPNDCTAELLLKGIRNVVAGQYWIGRNTVADLLESLASGTLAAPNGPLQKNSHLTPREIQIISGILRGESNKDIAKKFGLSENTVKHHLTHVFDKLGVGNRLELALFAMDRNLLGRRSAEPVPDAPASSPSN